MFLRRLTVTPMVQYKGAGGTGVPGVTCEEHHTG